MRKNINVIKELVRLRFQHLMMFRIGFFGPFFVDGSLFVVQLMVFSAVYANVERIGGWEHGQMILYIGTFSLINAINMVVYFFGVNSIPAKIKSGEMDLYLTKPVSPLLRLSLEHINPGSLPLILMSLVIIVYGAWEAELRIETGIVLSYLFWVVLMCILYYEMEIIFRSISFFLISTAKMEQLESACLELCMQLPGTVFYGVYKVVFYCILPYGIMATVPVKSLVGECTPATVLHALAVVGIFTGITCVLWRGGIRCYNSASS